MRARFLFPMVLAMAACGGDAASDAVLPTMSERGAFVVEVTPDRGEFLRGRNALTVTARTPEGRAVSLDAVLARMPGHAHAAEAPTFRPAGESWRVEDLVLGMPGRWDITLRFSDGSVRDDALVVTRVP